MQEKHHANLNELPSNNMPSAFLLSLIKSMFIICAIRSTTTSKYRFHHVYLRVNAFQYGTIIHFYLLTNYYMYISL